MLVRDAMTERPMTVAPDTPVREARLLLYRHRVTALPVVDAAGRLVGIASEADLIRDALAPDARRLEPVGAVPGPGDHPARVHEVYTPHARTVHPDDDLADAVELMTALGIKSLPVLDHQGRLVGIVSRSDVVAVLARDDRVIEEEVVELFRSMGHGAWSVQVEGGVVHVVGPHSPDERSIARVAAANVAGVAEVDVP